jgi:hypothetical protein
MVEVEFIAVTEVPRIQSIHSLLAVIPNADQSPLENSFIVENNMAGSRHREVLVGEDAMAQYLLEEWGKGALDLVPETFPLPVRQYFSQCPLLLLGNLELVPLPLF